MGAIELRHITKRFGGVPALDDVSLTLERGERLALIGENGAGKSSLMNVLYGLYRPDAGEVCFDGAPVRVRTPADALARGVGMVHQHFTLVPSLTVAENVVLGHEPTRRGRLDLARARREVAETCRRFGFEVDPAARVASLTVGSQQKVEIVKALHRGATTLVLDEPTAVLTPRETDELFAATRRLSEQGLTVVLISHKLRDVLAFATRIAVMRRGRKVGETTPAETTEAALAELMIGARAEGLEAGPGEGRSRGQTSAGPPRLALRSLSCEGLLKVDLEVRAGEVLGVAGVDGNGQRELAEVLTGLRPWAGGELLVDGAPQRRWTPALARAWGLAHVPEDRLRRALVADLTVEENVALGFQRRPPFSHGGRLIDFRGRRARTEALLEAHDVRPRSPAMRAGGLSGGNQQKLVVGRELDQGPRALVVVQPTRGLDLGAAAAVRRRLREQRDRGCAVLLVSLDLDEVLELSDRLVVLHAGAVSGRFDAGPFDAREVGERMLGVPRA